MAALADVRKVVAEVYASKKAEFQGISRQLWEHPEDSYQEYEAIKLLCQFLEQEGFQLERKFVSDTGFRASYSNVNATEEVGDSREPAALNACFICEYDAVCELGHAAGHNLQTMCSVAAAVALKRCLEKSLVKGQVTLLGTPGEMCGHGSKIDMLNSGAFENIDFCMMVAPFNQTMLYPKHFHLVVVEVNYIGKASHASAAPWEGRNALDAVVACYNNLALLRQQLKPNWHINAVITKGGTVPNVVPQSSQMKCWLRAPEQPDLVLMQLKCQACFVAAAKATGCEVQFEFEDKPNYSVIHNSTMAEIFQQEAQNLGISFNEPAEHCATHLGSTDMGNVSQTVPTILPAVDIGTTAPLHSEAFMTASGSESACEKMLLASQALAVSACEIMIDQKLVQYIRNENITLNRGTSGRRFRALSSD